MPGTGRSAVETWPGGLCWPRARGSTSPKRAPAVRPLSRQQQPSTDQSQGDRSALAAHSPYRGVCYNYLQYMKRYSKRTYSKGIDYYRISPRFSNEVVIDEYVEDWLHLLVMSEKIKIKIKELSVDSVANSV